MNDFITMFIASVDNNTAAMIGSGAAIGSAPGAVSSYLFARRLRRIELAMVRANIIDLDQVG